MRSTRVLAAGVLALALVACGSPSPPIAATSTITIQYPGDERVLGPYWEMPAKFLVFLPLVRAGEDGQLEPALARAWEHSDDYRTWTIHLRDGVKWHDGRAVTAHDVKFTYDLFSHPEVLWERPGSFSIEVLDDLTYRITCNDARVRPLSAWQVFYPKHLLEDLDPAAFQQWEFWKRPVGNGPYRYVRHVPQTAIELAADAEYYAGKPPIERVVLKLAANAGFTQLLSGEVDVAAFIDAAEAAKIGKDPKFRLYHGFDGDSFRAIAWNQRQPALRDQRVRRAFTLALDRRELLRVVNLPPDLPLFDAPFTDEQFRRRTLPPAMAFDRARAVALLEEAGWKDADGDGVRERGGQPLALRLLVSSEDEAAAVYVQDALRRVGAGVTIDRLELNIVRRRIRSGDFEAALRIFSNELGGNFGQLRMLGRESVIGYSNPEVWQLLDRATATFDPRVLDDIYGRLHAIFNEEVPMTFLYLSSTYVATRPHVLGLSSPFRAEPTMWMERLRLEGTR